LTDGLFNDAVSNAEVKSYIVLNGTDDDQELTIHVWRIHFAVFLHTWGYITVVTNQSMNHRWTLMGGALILFQRNKIYQSEKLFSNVIFSWNASKESVEFVQKYQVSTYDAIRH